MGQSRNFISHSLFFSIQFSLTIFFQSTIIPSFLPAACKGVKRREKLTITITRIGGVRKDGREVRYEI